MRVLYDVSVLGIGHTTLSARAGIFRVVERVGRGLAESAECDLQLCAHESLRALDGCLEYLPTNPHLGGFEILDPGWPRDLEGRLYGEIERITRRPELGVMQRAVRKILWEGRRALEHGFRRWGCSVPEDIDILHSPFGALPARATGAVPRARFLTVYDLIPVRFPHLCNQGTPRALEKIYRSLTPEDWVLAISEATKADLCEYRGTDPDRVFVTPLAADPELFHPCTDPGILARVRTRYGIHDGPYLLSLNTLEPRKNLDHAIRVFAALVQEERIPDLQLVLVGPIGWRYEKIFAAIEEAGTVRDRIVLAGYVADEDLASLYSGALAFVYPSFYEGFGLPPLEAMQCGVPVVTSNTSSLPEVVGHAGITVDPTDADELAQALLDLYRNPSLRDTMRAASLAQARKFSWDRCIQETLIAYRKALTAQGG
jgi:glycosyltransferase involved in cell wall biosynthesis